MNNKKDIANLPRNHLDSLSYIQILNYKCLNNHEYIYLSLPYNRYFTKLKFINQHLKIARKITMLYKITLRQDIIKPIKNHVFQKLILYLFKLVNDQTPIFTQYLLCMHKVSHEMISDITDSILDELNEWRDCPLKKCYAFVFVNYLTVTLRHDYESAIKKSCTQPTLLKRSIQVLEKSQKKK